MYGNIGRMIKNLAKGIFIIEAIAAIIVGIVFLIGEDMLLVGAIILLAGPIVAWVSTWLLYAFGELVEKTSENESNTYDIKIMLQQILQNQNIGLNEISEDKNKGFDSSNIALHRWKDGWLGQGEKIGRCDMCGQKKTEIIFAEFEDIFGKAQRNMCYDCFSKHDAKKIDK